MTNEIINNTEKRRYEIRVNGEQAGFAEYRLRGDDVVFTHTEIDGQFEGKGLGGTLVRSALDDVRARGDKVVPLCPFIKSWIERHPDYKDMVA